MRRLLYGQVVSRALCAVAVLGIPDILADSRYRAEELAAKCGADPEVLHQVLRALVPFGVFDVGEDATFGLTPLGAALRSDAKASALPTAMLVHGDVGRAWEEFLTTVRTGEPAFRALNGTDFFSYIDRRPEMHAVFHESQAHGLTIDLQGILRRVDFSDHRVLVDVGGGDGALLQAVLTKYPEARGVLVDLPTVVAEAGVRFASEGLAERVDLCSGDFFESLPPGGDLYMLRQITHDLDDERCARLLASCRRAMGDSGAGLLILDLLAEDRPATDADAQMTAIMNLYMMSVFGGRERTRSELELLLEEAGFAVRSVTPVAGQMSAVLARPV